MASLPQAALSEALTFLQQSFATQSAQAAQADRAAMAQKMNGWLATNVANIIASAPVSKKAGAGKKKPTAAVAVTLSANDRLALALSFLSLALLHPADAAAAAVLSPQLVQQLGQRAQTEPNFAATVQQRCAEFAASNGTDAAAGEWLAQLVINDLLTPAVSMVALTSGLHAKRLLGAVMDEVGGSDAAETGNETRAQRAAARKRKAAAAKGGRAVQMHAAVQEARASIDPSAAATWLGDLTTNLFGSLVGVCFIPVAALKAALVAAGVPEAAAEAMLAAAAASPSGAFALAPAGTIAVPLQPAAQRAFAYCVGLVLRFVRVLVPDAEAGTPEAAAASAAAAGFRGTSQQYYESLAPSTRWAALDAFLTGGVVTTLDAVRAQPLQLCRALASIATAWKEVLDAARSDIDSSPTLARFVSGALQGLVSRVLPALRELQASPTAESAPVVRQADQAAGLVLRCCNEFLCSASTMQFWNLPEDEKHKSFANGAIDAIRATHDELAATLVEPGAGASVVQFLGECATRVAADTHSLSYVAAQALLSSQDPTAVARAAAPHLSSWNVPSSAFTEALNVFTSLLGLPLLAHRNTPALQAGLYHVIAAATAIAHSPRFRPATADAVGRIATSLSVLALHGDEPAVRGGAHQAPGASPAADVLTRFLAAASTGLTADAGAEAAATAAHTAARAAAALEGAVKGSTGAGDSDLTTVMELTCIACIEALSNILDMELGVGTRAIQALASTATTSIGSIFSSAGPYIAPALGSLALLGPLPLKWREAITGSANAQAAAHALVTAQGEGASIVHAYTAALVRFVVPLTQDDTANMQGYFDTSAPADYFLPDSDRDVQLRSSRYEGSMGAPSRKTKKSTDDGDEDEEAEDNDSDIEDSEGEDGDDYGEGVINTALRDTAEEFVVAMALCCKAPLTECLLDAASSVITADFAIIQHQLSAANLAGSSLAWSLSASVEAAFVALSWVMDECFISLASVPGRLLSLFQTVEGVASSFGSVTQPRAASIASSVVAAALRCVGSLAVGAFETCAMLQGSTDDGDDESGGGSAMGGIEQLPLPVQKQLLGDFVACARQCVAALINYGVHSPYKRCQWSALTSLTSYMRTVSASMLSPDMELETVEGLPVEDDDEEEDPMVNRRRQMRQQQKAAPKAPSIFPIPVAVRRFFFLPADLEQQLLNAVFPAAEPNIWVALTEAQVQQCRAAGQHPPFRAQLQARLLASRVVGGLTSINHKQRNILEEEAAAYNAAFLDSWRMAVAAGGAVGPQTLGAALSAALMGAYLRSGPSLLLWVPAACRPDSDTPMMRARLLAAAEAVPGTTEALTEAEAIVARLNQLAANPAAAPAGLLASIFSCYEAHLPYVLRAVGEGIAQGQLTDIGGLGEHAFEVGLALQLLNDVSRFTLSGAVSPHEEEAFAAALTGALAVNVPLMQARRMQLLTELLWGAVSEAAGTAANALSCEVGAAASAGHAAALRMHAACGALLLPAAVGTATAADSVRWFNRALVHSSAATVRDFAQRILGALNSATLVDTVEERRQARRGGVVVLLRDDSTKLASVALTSLTDLCEAFTAAASNCAALNATVERHQRRFAAVVSAFVKEQPQLAPAVLDAAAAAANNFTLLTQTDAPAPLAARVGAPAGTSVGAAIAASHMQRLQSAEGRFANDAATEILSPELLSHCHALARRPESMLRAEAFSILCDFATSCAWWSDVVDMEDAEGDDEDEETMFQRPAASAEATAPEKRAAAFDPATELSPAMAHRLKGYLPAMLELLLAHYGRETTAGAEEAEDEDANDEDSRDRAQSNALFCFAEWMAAVCGPAVDAPAYLASYQRAAHAGAAHVSRAYVEAALQQASAGCGANFTPAAVATILASFLVRRMSYSTSVRENAMLSLLRFATIFPEVLHSAAAEMARGGADPARARLAQEALSAKGNAMLLLQHGFIADLAVPVLATMLRSFKGAEAVEALIRVAALASTTSVYPNPVDGSPFEGVCEVNLALQVMPLALGKLLMFMRRDDGRPQALIDAWRPIVQFVADAAASEGRSAADLLGMKKADKRAIHNDFGVKL